MGVSSSACRVAIAGASSLLGKELAAVIEERSFAATDLRLLDDEIAEGTLSEAGGEPVVIQGINEESFSGVRFAFFAGPRRLAESHWRQAQQAGATVVDLGGPLVSVGAAVPWIPALRKKLPPPRPAAGKLFYSPLAPSLIACTVAAGLRELEAWRLAITFFQPVSERGQRGIDELESQTVSLLSMKPISQEVFGTQIAFNLLGDYGEDNQERLTEACAEVSRDVAQYLAMRAAVPAIQMVQAPVFYGLAFTAYVELGRAAKPEALEGALEEAGVKVAESAGGSPSNVTVAGESQICLAQIRPDPEVEHAFWLWGAADNLRLAVTNAVSIAETLLAS